MSNRIAGTHAGTLTVDRMASPISLTHHLLSCKLLYGARATEAPPACLDLSYAMTYGNTGEDAGNAVEIMERCVKDATERGTSEMPLPGEFFDLGDFDHRDVFLEDEPVWSALDRLHDYLTDCLDGSWPLSGISGHTESALAVSGGKVIRDIETRNTGPKGRVQAFSDGKLIADAAIIMPGAFLFDDTIIIGSGSIVEPGALIKGPTVIGSDTEIRQGAYLRGDCLVGDGCVVGHATEMKASIMIDGSQAGHFAYVGDSILGKDVNLGAGTKLANLRMIPGEVVVKSAQGRERFATGRRKLGAILGDDTETGCNSVTSPGTLLAPRSIVYPGISIPGGFHSTRTTFMPPKDSPRIRSAKSK